MELSEKQKKHLRGLGHRLKPVARLGSAGASAAFLAELDRALAHHELVKVKIAAASREERDESLAAILARLGASLVTRIGNVAVLYRPDPDKPRLVLPAD